MGTNNITVVHVENIEEKAHIVEEVLLDLPEWFGLPESTSDYIAQSKELMLFEALDGDKIIGFITLKRQVIMYAKFIVWVSKKVIIEKVQAQNCTVLLKAMAKRNMSIFRLKL